MRLRNGSRHRPHPITSVHPDAAVLTMLKKMGVQTPKERQTQFYLYFPDKERAKSVQGELVNIGYIVEVIKSIVDSQWLCLASKTTKIDFSDLVSIRGTLEKLAEKYGGNYDGWEVELKADEVKTIPEMKKSRKRGK